MPKQILTVGHDAELFLYDENDNAIPSIGLVGGSKECPRVVNKNGGAVQEDNVMAELNIKPCTTSALFVSRTNEVMDALRTIIEPQSLHYKILDFQKFEPRFLKCKQARQFGCDPDRNVYTMTENVVDAKLLQKNHVRTAGGHIHIGMTEIDTLPMAQSSLVKGCDVFIGLPLTILERESQRKAFYGRAGSYREKEYGIEYRTPSNIWLSNDLIIEWVFRQVRILSREMLISLSNNQIPSYERMILDWGENSFQEVINNGYCDDAYDMCKNYGIEIPKLENK